MTTPPSSKGSSAHNLEHYLAAVVAPDEGEFSFSWWRENKLSGDVRLRGVIEWHLECNSSKEILTLRFSQPAIACFMLQLKAHITLAWRTEWDHAP
jgi:hypothetical protein